MAKKRQSRVPMKTGRVVHHFWLNLNKDIESNLDKAVHNLKKQRLFAETVRDGLRLILDLRAGSLDVLFELFPHLQERLAGQVVVAPPVPPTSDERLLKELREMKELLIQNPNIPDTSDTYKQMHKAGPKPLVAPTFSMPTFDDDDDLPTVTVNKNASLDASLNFVSSMLNVQ